MVNRNSKLATPNKNTPINSFVKHLLMCLFLMQSVVMAEAHDHDHDHDHDKPKGQGAIIPSRPPIERTRRRRRNTCGVNWLGLNRFANGDSYDYPNMVTFLSNPLCDRIGHRLAKRAALEGVSWNKKPPFRLDLYAKPLLREDLKGRDKTDYVLGEKMGNLLRQNPLSSDKLLPLIGQLSLLSPKAARKGLVNLAQQQLYTADALLRVPNAMGSKVVPTRVANALVRLGMNRPALAKAFANSVEEMAVLSQADSLGKIFRALGAAASVNSSLVSTFNLSAGAINRGVQRGGSQYSLNTKGKMIGAVYAAVRSAYSGSEQLEPSMSELNEAMFPLLSGRPLRKVSQLKLAWKEILLMLSDSPTQSVIAEAVALSLNPELVFLSADDRINLLMAARNYKQIAVAIQDNFLAGLGRLNRNLKSGKLSQKRMAELKGKFLEPWVSNLLELEPSFLTRYWIREVVISKLVRDEDVERRFPVFVLALLDRKEKATAVALGEGDVAPAATAMAENFSLLWTLSNLHMPVLWGWVERYDQSQGVEKEEINSAQAAGTEELVLNDPANENLGSLQTASNLR